MKENEEKRKEEENEREKQKKELLSSDGRVQELVRFLSLLVFFSVLLLLTKSFI